MSGLVVAIVPAYNEAVRVGDTVRALASFCDEVIVVDDGSTDATATSAQSAGARVIRLPRNRGKGAALAAGVQAAGTAGVLLLADADLGVSAKELRTLLPGVISGYHDVAIAAPAPGALSGLGMVESLARSGIRRLTGATFARPLSGQRAIRADVARELGFAGGFGAETAMTIDALRAGYRVVEVPCEFTHAKTGRDLAGFAHRARQGAQVAGALLRRSLRAGHRRGIVRP